ncbi:hypothetical protein FGB62_31g119 [Gracilaria domingensis]|nr:hypothetical protein FGB62_31g119 [Gracilaria domingensis]
MGDLLRKNVDWEEPVSVQRCEVQCGREPRGLGLDLIPKWTGWAVSAGRGGSSESRGSGEGARERTESAEERTESAGERRGGIGGSSGTLGAVGVPDRGGSGRSCGSAGAAKMAAMNAGAMEVPEMKL